MRYSLVFLFNHDLSKVLLLHKNRGPYLDTLNGVGGKLEITDSSIEHCAVREIEEETRAIINQGDLVHIITCEFNSNVFLHVFAATVDESIPEQRESEQIEWCCVSQVLNSLVTDERFAGNGNVPYFVNVALKTLMARTTPLDGDTCDTGKSFGMVKSGVSCEEN